MAGLQRVRNGARSAARPSTPKHSALGAMVARGWISDASALLALWDDAGLPLHHGSAESLRVIREGLIDRMARPYPDLVASCERSA